MPLLQSLLVHKTSPAHTACRYLFVILAIVSTGSVALADSAATTTPFHQSNPQSEGIFLVATEKLHGTRFQQVVILLTHYSKRGATGLTINRPSGIALQQAFPNIRQLRKRTDPLFLGGPVSTNAIFVLLRTLQPNASMHRVAGDIYFSTGKNAFGGSANYSTRSTTRTYAGYAGWAGGQLQNEINRGDWLIVHTRPEIIFEKNTESLWQSLTKRWTGKWI